MVFGKDQNPATKTKKTTSRRNLQVKQERIRVNLEVRRKKALQESETPTEVTPCRPQQPSNDSTNSTHSTSDDDSDYNPKTSALTMQEKRDSGFLVATEEEVRMYIKVSYIIEFNEPAEDEWDGIAKTLRERLGVRKETVMSVFKRCQAGDEKPEKQKEGAGRKRKLAEDDAGLIAGAAALNSAVPPNMATMICNAVNKRKFDGTDEEFIARKRVCRNTMMDTIAAYTDYEKSAVQRRKTGSKDEESDWARARSVLAKQMKKQLEDGMRLDNGESTLEEAMKLDCPPIWKDGVLWVDENHVVATLGGNGHGGSSSKTQHRVSVDRKTGKLKPLKKGGKMPKKRYRTVAKYTKESRGAYGCAVPMINGKLVPQFMKSWNYTATTLKSWKVYKALMKKENKKRQDMTTLGWKDYNSPEPYKERFPNTWKKELDNGHYFSVIIFASNIRDLVDHVIAEGQRIFKGTARENTWMIYHDHLKIWWEKETQAYLKTLKCPIAGNPNRTWYDRQIKICGENNGKVAARYKNCLPGDSPELMPLDCHLFGDMKEAACNNVALTFHLQDTAENPNPKKYSFATPDKVWNSLQRTLTSGFPSASRIQQDCFRVFDETLDRIIAAKGTYIEDSSGKKRVRTGGRLQAQLDEEREQKRREKIGYDPEAMESFNDMLEKLVKGEGVSFPIDMTQDDDVYQPVGAFVLEDVPVQEEDDDDIVDDVDKE